MTKEEIRERLNLKPFKPFTVRLADGMEIEVPTGDHAHLHPVAVRFLCIWNRAGLRSLMWRS